MSTLRRLVAVLALPVALPAVAAAAEDAQAPDALAEEAARACREGDLDAAAETLRALAEEFETRAGADHTATALVRLRLAAVERARGDAAAARALEERAASGSGDGGLPPALEGAVASLRDCRKPVRSSSAPKLEKITVDDRLKLARGLLARGLYRQALEAAETARESLGMGPSPRTELDLHHVLAAIHVALGDRDAALEAASRARGRALVVGDVDARITLARLVAAAGDLERAGKELEELEGGAAEPSDRAELAEARADLQLRLGSPRDALVLLEDALSQHRETYGAEDRSTAAVLHLQGDAHRLAGDFPAAKRKYTEALRVRTAALGPRHPETASTRNALGVLEADLGDFAAADRSFGAALEVLDEALGAEHPDTIAVRANRARARWGRAESRAAADAYEATVESLAEALGEDHPSVAEVVTNLARIEFELGNPERAEALLERALGIQQRTLGSDHPARARTRLIRARLLARRGQLEAAAAEVGAATASLTGSLGAGHPWVARARTAGARIAVARGDGKAAFREARIASGALAEYMRRTFGAISDRQRALLAEDAQDVVGALLSVPEADPRELYVALLPHRDSVLRSIAAGRAAVDPDDPAAELRRRLVRLRQRYVAAVLSQGAGSARRVQELARAIDGLEAMASSAGDAAARPDPDAVLRRACAALPADAALVRYAAYDRTTAADPGRTRPAYAALVVRGAGCEVRFVDLGPAGPIEEAAESFAGAMRFQRLDAARPRQALSEQVVAPLMDAVGDSRRWLVVPDSSLWGVPLGALPDPRSPDDYLIERVTVGYLTSTFELAESRAGGAAKPSQVLLVGDPDFGETEDGGPVVLTSTGPCEIRPFEMLPATEKELVDIREVMDVEPHVLTGAGATKTALTSELRHAPRLLHFATHAYFAGQAGCGTARSGDDGLASGSQPIAPNPLLLSGIVLAGANEPARVDGGLESGILTAYEVAGLDLRAANLVVLSACDTGTGLHSRGQEVQGLRWGFRAAGARALVSSLWRSNDAATRRMMQDFYRSLYSEELGDDALRGAEALRRAQLEQLSADKRLGIRRPLLWANFIFSGVL